MVGHPSPRSINSWLPILCHKPCVFLLKFGHGFSLNSSMIFFISFFFTKVMVIVVKYYQHYYVMVTQFVSVSV